MSDNVGPLPALPPPGSLVPAGTNVPPPDAGTINTDGETIQPLPVSPAGAVEAAGSALGSVSTAVTGVATTAVTAVFAELTPLFVNIFLGLLILISFYLTLDRDPTQDIKNVVKTGTKIASAE